jgi:NADPH-dependent curcumin reductase CurA
MPDSLRSRRIVLASRPHGEPVAANFDLDSRPLPALADGDVLLKSRYLSIDICARGTMDADRADGDSMALGDVMGSGAICEVLASRAAAFKPGEFVLAYVGWQSHAVVAGRELKRKLYPKVAPVSTGLGVYGLYGYIAYCAIDEIIRPLAGQTVVVPSAAGPTGATAAQIARQRGARVVGITSGADKVAYCQALGMDAVVDRLSDDFEAELALACPHGVDGLLEQGQRDIQRAVLPRMNDLGRIAICALPGDAQAAPGHGQSDQLPLLLESIFSKRLSVRGFTERDVLRVHPQQLVDPRFVADMGGWLREGQIAYREDIVHGLEQAPAALNRLLRGENFGKLLVAVD